MAAKQKSLKSLILSGSIWTLGGYGASQILRLGNHLLLAWLLAPEIFGLMALVYVVQSGFEMFSDIGIVPSIIQSKRGDDPLFLNTAWTIQFIRGIGMWVCVCILAWPFAAFFGQNDPAAWQLRYILPVAGFISVLQGFNSTSLATLNKHLHLGRITLLDLASQIVSLATMITWALFNPTIWALVSGGLAGAVFKMIASHMIVPNTKVRPDWDQECVKELFKFGRWIFLSTAFTFLSGNLDRLILGKILSLTELGLYSIALVFAKVALNVSLRLGITVLFPVYSKFRDDPNKMVSIALRARENVLMIGIAVCICFAVGAPLFFKTCWDPRYHQAGRTAQWLAIYIWTMVVLATIDGLPLALGNSKALFFANIWRCSGFLFAAGGYMLAKLPGFIVGLSLGPVVAHAYILFHIPARRKEIVAQGLKFSIGGLFFGLFAVLITKWAGSNFDQLIFSAMVVMIAIIPLILSAWIVWTRIRSEGILQ